MIWKRRVAHGGGDDGVGVRAGGSRRNRDAMGTVMVMVMVMVTLVISHGGE